MFFLALSGVLLSSDSSQDAAVLPQNEAVGGFLSGLNAAITAPEQKARTERSLVYFCISLLVIYDPAALRSNLAASPVED